MTKNQKLIAVTTIREGDKYSPNERMRAEVFLDTAENLRVFGIPCIAVFEDCSDEYIRTVSDLGVVVTQQSKPGMSNARREALRVSFDHYPEATHCLWLEPEKPGIPRFASGLVKRMLESNAALGLFNRLSMKSYPSEQAYYYLFCRAVASRLVGFDLDYAFGPMILTRESIPFFLDYSDEYGGLWDSILIPRLRVIKSGLVVVTRDIRFSNDPRMTEMESGNQSIILKRIRQLNNVVPSLIEEWQRSKV